MKSLVFVVALASACGSSKSAPPVAAPAVSVAAEGLLALGELEIIDVNKQQTIAIHADGLIEIAGKTGVKVTADGKLVRVDTGEVGFALQPDGTIHGPDGKPIDVTLGANAVITSGDKKIHLDDAGNLVGANPDAPPVRVAGASSLGLKRTALFVLIALTTPEPAPAPEPATAP